MKVRYTGDHYKVYHRRGEVYDAVLVDGFYWIYNENDGESYGYLPENFEVIEQGEDQGADGKCLRNESPPASIPLSQN